MSIISTAALVGIGLASKAVFSSVGESLCTRHMDYKDSRDNTYRLAATNYYSATHMDGVVTIILSTILFYKLTELSLVKSFGISAAIGMGLLIISSFLCFIVNPLDLENESAEEIQSHGMFSHSFFTLVNGALVALIINAFGLV